MRGQSNSFMLFLTVVAVISLVFSLFVHYIGSAQLTGFVIGTVNVTVNVTAGISLSRSAVNFTVTNPDNARNTYTATDLTQAPLSAGVLGCASMESNTTCGINITNDGTVNINVTMQDTGSAIFKSGTFSRLVHFLFNVSVPYSARNTICPNSATSGNGFYNVNNTHIRTGGFVPTINWTPVNTSALRIICGLNFTNTGYGRELKPDVAAVEFNISVPNDESGGDKGTTLDFVGSSSGL